MPNGNRFLQRISVALPLGRKEREALEELLAHSSSAEPGRDIVVDGEAIDYGYVFERGWGCRYKLVEDGRRQILNFVLPGDYVGASGRLVQAADHSIAALTRAELIAFPSAALAELGERLPRLRAAFEWSNRRDLAMLQERIVDIGRRSAYERMAHLILELHQRLALVGLADDDGFDLPLTQEMLADALGLTVVHVNRTLRRLRESGTVTIAAGRVTIVDRGALVDIADFDGGYLHQMSMPEKTLVRFTN